MEEEIFSCFNPVNTNCHHCQTNYRQDTYIYPFPGLPFGFENMWEDDAEEHEHKDSSPHEHRATEDFDENENSEEQTRAVDRVDEILYRIERNNPMIIRSLTMARIPYRAARNIIRHIVYLTLSYAEKPTR